MIFPDNFSWGAATASYQIEGGAFADGKGPSIWDAMSRTPGKIYQGNTGTIACDHYHRYKEDVQLMSRIGLKAYRFSISWPRVLPEGVGTVNEAGLGFYDRLVDTLLENGIEPWVTLFHWDYPLALYYRGGWLNRDSADWFAEYTAVITDRLSDRVARWMPQNEPQCFIGLGHWTGENAPGLNLSFSDVLRAAHHTLLAHGKAVQVIRARSKQPALIGAAPVGITKIPANNSLEDIEAARACMFAVKDNLWNNSWFADPMIFGRYPEDGLQAFAIDLPEIRPGDMETICQPLDFYGVNIYHADIIRADSRGGWEEVSSEDGHPLTTMKWKLMPECLYWGPRFFYERYKLPIVITENGMANTDWVQLDGHIHDTQRVDFITRYLRCYRQAIADGVEALGYFHWTLLDNFEWNEGYSQRFGIIYVNFETQERTLKDSALWYKEIIAGNGTVLEAT